MLIIEHQGRYLHQIQGASRYYVSKCGAIYSDNVKRLLRPSPQTKGYLQVPLTLAGGIRKAQLLHRLVAQHFVHNPDPTRKLFVNHKNGNKNDCRACNLEWVTAKENDTHARETGLSANTQQAVSPSIIRGFCAPMQDYQAKPRFYYFEPVPTSCSKPDTNA
jgi:HNH endonuclease